MIGLGRGHHDGDRVARLKREVGHCHGSERVPLRPGPVAYAGAGDGRREAGLEHLAAAFGLPYQRLDQPEDLGKALPGTGLRIVEARTDRAAGAALRGRLREVAAAAVRAVL